MIAIREGPTNDERVRVIYSKYNSTRRCLLLFLLLPSSVIPTIFDIIRNGCGDRRDECCDGLQCRLNNIDQYNPFWQCLHDSDSPPIQSNPPTPNPTPMVSPAPVSVSSPPVTAPPTLYLDPRSSDFVTGKATYYGGNPSGGACGYSSLPTVSFPFGMSAAVGGEIFDNGYGCGACYEISCVGPFGYNPSCYCDGTQDSVIVQATDQCPECESTHFDLNTDAMYAITGEQLAGTCGVIETLWRQVSCPFQTNISLRSKSGTSGTFLGCFWFGLF